MDNDTPVKTWHPTDFGFYAVPFKEGVYKNGAYELRMLETDMWLLRRFQTRGTAKVSMVKFYYMIKPVDYEFANWLLNKRLNKV
jgi:hypothetical protein